jgi:hypothetical protein
MSGTAWELLFMMLILKLPIAYLGWVVYWAIKSEPSPPEPALLPAVPEDPDRPPAWTATRRPRRRPPRGGPDRTPRERTARAAVR